MTSVAICLILPCSVLAQKDSGRITRDSKRAKAEFLKADPSMEHFFSAAYGYAILPNVGKGAMIVGGGGGNGAVYQGDKHIGTTSMVQGTVGAQIGGQAFREVIFFENKAVFDRFRANQVEFNGQVSALAVKTGVSATAAYRDGVAIFTQGKEGFMAEVSVGGQKFTFMPL